ncbi:MAG: sterol desaturase family protein [Hylemonella sp.]
MDWLAETFSAVQQKLYEGLVQPLVFGLGFSNRLEEAYSATAWLLIGGLELLMLLAVVGPLQRWRPAQKIADPLAVRTDILYTLIHRLGLFRLALMLTVMPLLDQVFGALRMVGVSTWHLDQLWPGVTDQAVVSLLLYLLILDFIGYWIHRAQHQLGWWWQLHALHHSQQDMTMWSDSRNHLLDDLLHACLLAMVAQLIGVAPAQFVLIVVITQLSESLQHANVRLFFGAIGERLWISPHFHRRHHSIGFGHESPAGPDGRHAYLDQAGQLHRLGGHNFGVLLPWWDMLFGTASFDRRYDPTGVRDQVEQGRNYGRGFWAQQWLGLKRLAGRA